MKVGGCQRNPFTRSAFKALFARSDGVPRLINIIADRALAGAYAQEKQTVNARLVHAAANEVQPSEPQVHANRWPWLVAAASGVALIAVTVGLQRFSVWEQRPVAHEPVLAEASPAMDAAPPVQDPPAQEFPGHTGAVAGDGLMQADRSGWMDQDWLNRQHAQAWQVMAGLWQDGDNADAVRAACEGVPGTGYACLHDQGSWARVAQLGLPVILVLHDDQTRYLVLRGINDEFVLVGGEAAALEISRRTVERNWLGEFIVPWPQAPDWPSQIQRGETGSAVDIVMEMAAYADPAWSGSGLFDAGFESWLMAFQRRHGLEADGIVGPNTLLYLMAPTIAQPRLIVDQDERS
jgi:general secretion pathway protein A